VPWTKTPEAAAYLQVHVETLRNWARKVLFQARSSATLAASASSARTSTGYSNGVGPRVRISANVAIAHMDDSPIAKSGASVRGMGIPLILWSAAPAGALKHDHTAALR